MELDFSAQWWIIPSQYGAGPASFAATELAAVIGRMGGALAPLLGDESRTERIIVLDAGTGAHAQAVGGARRLSRFSWRAAEDRVEIYGEDEAALLRGAYDFLRALGAVWVEPGEAGERLPEGPLFSLEYNSRSSSDSALSATLILGHGCFLERWEDYLPWAARSGYSSIFVHTTPDELAMGAAPECLYEAQREGIAEAAQRLGLYLELGGHGLSSLLPRALFKEEPELFREKEGERVADCNFCPSSERALALVVEAFAAKAVAHPEVRVFHVWPDDLPGGGWCSCHSCTSLPGVAPVGVAQSLKIMRTLAAVLERVRPDAALSFLAYHDTEDIAAALGDGASLPANLELLWAPRLRSWGRSIGDPESSLNAASLAAFAKNASAWRLAGGGRVAVFEYYEDAVLFKTAVPPLSSVMEGDVAAYRSAGAQAVGILCTGGRLPLAPRPNIALFPRLATQGGAAGAHLAEDILADWVVATYGVAGKAMRGYWRELEAAWAIDLDLEKGDSAIYMPSSTASYASDPPADWGDPWKAGLERLAEKRGRCEELFEHLRAAEAILASVSSEDSAARREASEYAICDAVLELDCARLAVYHELAGGDARAAADIANLALSATGAARKAYARLPDARERREMGLVIGVYYELRFRLIRRANARSGLRRLLDLWFTTARAAISALRVRGAYRP
jgi:hypothetical protein